MIGKLTGVVDSVAADHAVIDVGGVGYVVQCPASTLAKLSAGAHASLMIETRITDETIRLYGFAGVEEREWFRLLQTVQNVGARVALNLLSVLAPPDLARAIALGDKAAIGRAPGIGPKLASRIASELKDKAPGLMMRGAQSAPEASPAAAAARGRDGEAVAALVHLGYSQIQAAEVVARAAQSLGDVPLEVLIRECLRQMAR
ncbi:MAG: Holliday junction branch migration protein RuvA [Alphaproteobacteria bacterium]|nr:Holliday junction branch migration protein RuvA [Alphaproteobacteria bacterium]MBN9570509.1 Holliday junction branch migration protein RuvA [Alphaproteobacteria bacterium]MBN9578330.1 Holliday junction branch migration protein RuvA [Alphaproteobacteria bacterium]OJU56486.1 MAG: Holliday junction DNA helicase RuvA [Alphaproteobacteria bacterium 62-8]